MPATLFKKRLWHRCFHVNFSKFLRTLFLQNTSGDSFCLSNCVCISIFFLMTFLFYELCLSQVFSKVSLTRLGHFCSLKENIHMIRQQNSRTLASLLPNVSWNLIVFKKQEQAAQFPARKLWAENCENRGDIIILLNIFIVTM